MPGDPHTAQLWSASATKSHDNSFHLNQAIRLTEMVVADYMPALRQPNGMVAPASEAKGSWHLAQLTNSQKSNSCWDVDTADIVGDDGRIVEDANKELMNSQWQDATRKDSHHVKYTWYPGAF